jgi:RNA polymerase sigma-70 factor (ECF subfamily)
LELDDSIQIKDDGAPGAKTPEESVIQKSDIKFLRQNLLLLPPDLRTLVIMRDIQDYSYQEISEHLDIPLGTTKSRINRARTKLAKIILEKKEGH